MTRLERLQTISPASCCLCEHALTIQELDEFRGCSDERLHSDVYCRSCREEQLPLCRECSVRYTADGICEECAAHEYALAV